MWNWRWHASPSSRAHRLALIADIDGLLPIGSNYGYPNHPAWSTNLPAYPECTVQFVGAPTQYTAELLTGDARPSVWATATDIYASYERYQASCMPREIRVFRLRPIARSERMTGCSKAMFAVARAILHCPILGVHGLFK
jgi:deazaflavin-dependent oxidoreductase (nitroreductase family)